MSGPADSGTALRMADVVAVMKRLREQLGPSVAGHRLEASEAVPPGTIVRLDHGALWAPFQPPRWLPPVTVYVSPVDLRRLEAEGVPASAVLAYAEDLAAKKPEPEPPPRPFMTSALPWIVRVTS